MQGMVGLYEWLGTFFYIIFKVSTKLKISGFSSQNVFDEKLFPPQKNTNFTSKQSQPYLVPLAFTFVFGKLFCYGYFHLNSCSV
jgi:hypothetical protein